MLQRTRAKQVLPLYRRLVDKYQSPEDWLADPEPLSPSCLGLPIRGDQYRKLNRIIAVRGFPTTRQEMLELPGVGEYIASAMLTFHLGHRAKIIDANVVRFYGRFLGFETHGETRRKKWFIELCEQLTPRRAHRAYNYALLDFSRSICTPRPRCPECPLRRKCAYAKR